MGTYQAGVVPSGKRAALRAEGGSRSLPELGVMGLLQGICAWWSGFKNYIILNPGLQTMATAKSSLMPVFVNKVFFTRPCSLVYVLSVAVEQCGVRGPFLWDVPPWHAHYLKLKTN